MTICWTVWHGWRMKISVLIRPWPTPPRMMKGKRVMGWWIWGGIGRKRRVVMPTSEEVGQIYAKSGPAAHEVCCAYSMVGETTIHEFSFDFEGNIWFTVWTLTEP